MKLGEESLVPVVSPDESGAPTWWLPDAPTDIIPCLHCLPKTSPWPITSHMEEKYKHLNFKSVYNSSLGPTLRAMAIEGFGLAWIPLTIVKEDLASGRLVRAAKCNDDIHVEITIYRRTNANESKIDDFWQALIEQEKPQLEQI
jgi:DNA-binding transcriptional LysR family regulator